MYGVIRELKEKVGDVGVEMYVNGCWIQFCLLIVVLIAENESGVQDLVFDSESPSPYKRMVIVLKRRSEVVVFYYPYGVRVECLNMKLGWMEKKIEEVG